MRALGVTPRVNYVYERKLTLSVSLFFFYPLLNRGSQIKFGLSCVLLSSVTVMYSKMAEGGDVRQMARLRTKDVCG